MFLQAFFVAVFGLAAIGFGVAVFRTASMVRSALALLFSQAAVGCMFLAMQSEFLGVLQIMMMATEMSIMAIFMVMFMMDPGGLGGMDMSHQKRFSIGAGVIAAGTAFAVALVSDWGPVTVEAPDAAMQARELGIEMLGRSMLIFETAAVTILTAMIAATAVAIPVHEPARNDGKDENDKEASR
ncbi:NADH-quinone oxidoreductase subunit J [Halomonas rhizosphaerae]|uniref:NADH-quinone oxidoreductase subunit J n=1 Tax=Halomonas rhizosphaerae TaxID=3043296 RepID=A0ABT6UUC7_9GAMM|nr:NADH-quinone oxidoreductase subunit J [Halomonas rhizosphaerae]MDI5889558.1 NADH-quinone oxidoreductase subunit J [Halomonas rhizosphaerae]MDI5919198.1 NADH-quinone oxidoreductase subunit J [Halomonas rhizosphaerae]